MIIFYCVLYLFRITYSLSFEISKLLLRFTSFFEINSSPDSVEVTRTAQQLSSLLLSLGEVVTIVFQSIQFDESLLNQLAGIHQLGCYTLKHQFQDGQSKTGFTTNSLFVVLLTMWERLFKASQPDHHTLIHMSIGCSHAIINECPKWIQIFTLYLLEIVGRCGVTLFFSNCSFFFFGSGSIHSSGADL